MTTHLQPNEWVEKILTGIGDADQKLIDHQTATLIDENAKLTGNHEGFLFGMTFFTNLPRKKIRTAKKVPLHPSLYDDGTKLAKTVKEFENDTQRLKQGLLVLLRHCKTTQDVRDALPNSIRIVLPELSGLPRTRDVAWTLKENPRLFDQYLQTEKILFYYLSSRMLY